MRYRDNRKHKKTVGLGFYIAELLADQDFKGQPQILGVEEGLKHG